MTRDEQTQMDAENVMRESEKVRDMGGDPVKILKDFLESATDQENYDTFKVRCVKCKGVLFVAAVGFWEKKHKIEIKCRKCGYKNNFYKRHIKPSTNRVARLR